MSHLFENGGAQRGLFRGFGAFALIHFIANKGALEYKLSTSNVFELWTTVAIASVISNPFAVLNIHTQAIHGIQKGSGFNYQALYAQVTKAHGFTHLFSGILPYVARNAVLSLAALPIMAKAGSDWQNAGFGALAIIVSHPLEVLRVKQ